MRLLALFIGVLFFGSLQASALEWEFFSLTPNCRAGLYCEKSEIADQVATVGLVKRFIGMAEQAQKRDGHLYMAFMSFSEPTLFEGLCGLGKRGLEFDGFFDSKAGPPSGLGYRLENQCQGPTSGNVRVHYMGMPKSGRSGWRLHHNKYFLADYGTRGAEIVFGSANVSNNGVSINFENWNFVTGHLQEDFLNDFLCDAKAMIQARKAGNEEDDPDVFRDQLERCLSYSDLSPPSVEKLLKRPGGVVLFAPDPLDRNFKLLKNQIDRIPKGGRIQMAVYFFMHKPLIHALQAAVKRGVPVDLLIDDDLENGHISIPTQKTYWYELIRPEASGFSIRYLDTNETAFQMQHNKYVILHGVDGDKPPRVFGGAGQFTQSAFETNYENFFYVEDRDVVEKYIEQFESLWGSAQAL